MILFLTLLYIAVLWLAFKKNILVPTVFWKLSPLLWSAFLMVALFIPLQFWAPSGPLIAGNYTIPIIPQVAGVVTDIYVTENQSVAKGEVLFEMDKTLFEADVRNQHAGLKLAQIRMEQARRLAANNAGSQFAVEQYASQVEQMQASLIKAQYNLDQATVRAPADGFVTNIALRPGSRVLSFPVAPAMSFLESGELVVGTFIAQSHLRYIQAGQSVEIAFKMYPGKVFAASVKQLVPARATGFEAQTGLPVAPQTIEHAPFAVTIELDDEARALNLPSGATGRVMIYSGKGSIAHVIRKIELRVEAIMNYVNPF